MSIKDSLINRSGNKCELCTSTENITAYPVPPRSDEEDDNQAVICNTCLQQIENPDNIDVNHWRCLNESIWSEVPAVKVLAYRILKQLEKEDWATDLVNMMYLEEKTLEWAEQGLDSAVIHKDANGHVLKAGDSVVLIKDLNVKGANFIAKRGTAVRRISLVRDNANHIEGRVNDQHIVILTQYVKKT